MESLFDSLRELQDIQRLIDEKVPESTTLEYKQADKPLTNSDRNEIAKDVSALANGAGGTLIYGVAIDATYKTLPDRIVPILPKNVESINQVISSKIRPYIQGIRQRQIPANDPQVFVVDVPSSDHSPHQCLEDCKYYQRQLTQNIPMTHDLVALHFGRRLQPRLEATWKIDSAESPKKEFHTFWNVTVGLKNSGKRFARNLLLRLSFENAALVVVYQEPTGFSPVSRSPKQVFDYVNNIMILHPTLSQPIAGMQLGFVRHLAEYAKDDPVIAWSAFAEDMEPQHGSLSFADFFG